MKCRLCEDENFQLLIDFGLQPIVHHLLDSKEQLYKTYPFKLGNCHTCGFLQLVDHIPGEVLYQNYFTISSWKNQPHVQRLLEVISAIHPLTSSSKILEIGCNDGSFLNSLKNKGLGNLVGIEPTQDASSIAIEKGFDVHKSFWNQDAAEKISTRYGYFDLIVTRQVLEHVESLHDFLASTKKALHQNGLLVIEIPDSSWNLEQLDYALWEEHINYFTIETINYLLKKQGFRIIHHEVTLFSGTALTIFAEKTDSNVMESPKNTEQNDIKKYGSGWEPFKEQFRKLLEGKEATYVYGCGARSSTLINFLCVADLLQAYVDDQPQKQNKYVPGSKLPILPSANLPKRDEFILLGVNTENEQKVILKNNFEQAHYNSILPPSKYLPDFWKDLIDA